MGSWRIKWYLECYRAIEVLDASVYRILKRQGINRLNKNVSKRYMHTKRYSKTVRGHHVQVDVKFIYLLDPEGNRIRRYQYTAIDDAKRIRTLKMYVKYIQVNTIQFIDYVVDKFPFGINTIRTDHGHEFQAKIYWHVEDNGMRHHYIKPRSPYLNGKVERSHRLD